jgi:hypothetical protein
MNDPANEVLSEILSVPFDCPTTVFKHALSPSIQNIAFNFSNLFLKSKTFKTSFQATLLPNPQPSQA